MLRITEGSRPWWTLAGACSGLFMLMLDSTIVALALTTVREELAASASQLQWVMNGYLLTIAVLVISAGRLGDMLGRKRVFVAGMAIFAAGSAVSAIAADPAMLIAGRAIQGIGAAPMLTLSLAIVCNVFPAGGQARALGIWAAVSAIALAVGPVIGGALIAVDWRLIFWINLPIIATGVALILAAAPESRDPGAGARLDYAGLLALSLALGGLVLAMIQSREWPAAVTAGLLILGVAAAFAFWRIEHRVRDPIVDFELFRNRPYLGASAAGFAVAGTYWVVMYYQPQFLQDSQGHSALDAGLLILPVTAPMVLISPFTGWLIRRFGARGLMTAGMACGTAGLALMTAIDAGTSYGFLLVAYLLFGICLGLVYAPMSAAAMAAMPASKVGIAAGVLAMDRIVAASLALALTGAAFHAIQAGGEGFTAAIAGSTWVPAAIAAIGAVLTWAFVRDPERLGPDPAVAGEPPEAELHHHRHHRRFHL